MVLRCCAGATLLCGVRASHCGGFYCCGARALGTRSSVVVANGLSSCSAWAYLLCGMWDLPGPGLEPMSPALAGRFLTSAPPGKPLIVVLICIFLGDSWCWVPFLVLLTMCMSSLEKCLFRSFAHFKTRLFLVLLLSCMSSLHILNSNHLSDIWFANIFSHSVSCLFILLICTGLEV